jgi:hypothetical protein
MAEKQPIHESRLKHLATLVASVAALLTSMAALMQACDKSVEKKSYEVLAGKIVELQEVQAQPPPPNYQNDMFIPIAEPSSATTSAPSGSPAASSAPLAVRSQPKNNPSPPTPMERPAPPPAWGDLVKSKPAF